MIPDDMVASLEDFLQTDENGELAAEINAALERLQLRLETESQKMHLRSTFHVLDAAQQVVQASLLTMALYEAGNAAPLPTT